ncbi:MAG TPA: cellulose binding domain-containing protein [Micromonosporaceae bacterium]|nr:cellulose binding domain-containing protein [Micromonosporaceae bacterium]
MSMRIVWLGERRIAVTAPDLAVPGVIDWGDGTGRARLAPGHGAEHTYAVPGAVTITLFDLDGVERDRQVLFVRSGTGPAVAFNPGADNPNIIDITWSETERDLVSAYTVDYGDADPIEVVTAPYGHVKSRAYRAGDYTARLYDQQAMRWGRFEFTVHDPVYDPEFTLRQGDDRYTVIATLTRLETPGKEVLIDWGDGLQDRLPAAQVGTEVSHVYGIDDYYIIQCGYADGSTDGSAQSVEIPWPVSRPGPKPAPMLQWSPDASDPLAVWARWFGAPGSYTMKWGDGTEDRMATWQPPKKHVYASAGTYQATCIADLHAEWTISTDITVRAALVPQASFALVAPGSNQVRATLGPVAAPVRYQIDWGDHIVTEHGANDLAPVHEYAWNTTAPAIVVRDVPARRLGRFTGPDIGPVPTPTVLDGFFLEYVSEDADHRRFRLRGGGLAPGATATWYPHHLSWFREVTADANGEVTDEVDIRRGTTADMDDRWLSFGIVGDTVPRQYIPVHPKRAAAGAADLTYQIDPANPHTLTFSATPPMLGEHMIDFGDGVQTTVDVQALPMKVKHTYTQTADITATVTLPDGRTAVRGVHGYTPAEPCFNHYYPGSVSVTWLFNGWPEHGCPAGGRRGIDGYTPVIIDNGYHVPHQIHRPDNRDGWHIYFGYGMPVGTHVFDYTSTFLPTTEHPVTVTKAAFRRLQPPPVEEGILLDPNAEVTAWFGDVVEWDGGYSGKFFVTNHTDAPVGWSVDFTIDAPAVVREVWPDSVELVQVSDTAWRLKSTQPLGTGAQIEVGVRIEPPGEPDQFPRDITAAPLE